MSFQNLELAGGSTILARHRPDMLQLFLVDLVVRRHTLSPINLTFEPTRREYDACPLGVALVAMNLDANAVDFSSKLSQCEASTMIETAIRSKLASKHEGLETFQALDERTVLYAETDILVS
jgi:hypothetical protein